VKAAKVGVAAGGTVGFTVDFGGGPPRRRQVSAAPAAILTTAPLAVAASTLAVTAAAPPVPGDPPDVPVATKRLVVAYYFEQLIEIGIAKDYAEIARLTGLSRARVTQLADLTLHPSTRLNAILLSMQATSSNRSSETRLRFSTVTCHGRGPLVHQEGAFPRFSAAAAHTPT